MKIIFTSLPVIAPQQCIDSNVVNTLTAMCSDEVSVVVVSNHPKPTWFDEVFKDEKNVIFFTAEAGKMVLL
jgi:hypothetical protein